MANLIRVLPGALATVAVSNLALGLGLDYSLHGGGGHPHPDEIPFAPPPLLEEPSNLDAFVRYAVELTQAEVYCRFELSVATRGSDEPAAQRTWQAGEYSRSSGAEMYFRRLSQVPVFLSTFLDAGGGVLNGAIVSRADRGSSFVRDGFKVFEVAPDTEVWHRSPLMDYWVVEPAVIAVCPISDWVPGRMPEGAPFSLRGELSGTVGEEHIQTWVAAGAEGEMGWFQFVSSGPRIGSYLLAEIGADGSPRVTKACIVEQSSHRYPVKFRAITGAIDSPVVDRHVSIVEIGAGHDWSDAWKRFRQGEFVRVENKAGVVVMLVDGKEYEVPQGAFREQSEWHWPLTGLAAVGVLLVLAGAVLRSRQ